MSDEKSETPQRLTEKRRVVIIVEVLRGEISGKEAMKLRPFDPRTYGEKGYGKIIGSTFPRM